MTSRRRRPPPQGPDINDMLRSQEASRKSKLLESRIQASLLTIANWKREGLEGDDGDDDDSNIILLANDSSRTGCTSPGTSCGSFDTVKVVRFDPDGDKQELPQRSGLFPQSMNELNEGARESSKAVNAPRKKGLKTKPHKKEKILSNEQIPLKDAFDKSANVESDEKNLCTVIAKPPVDGKKKTRVFAPPSESPRRSSKSKKTRGQVIRSMKEYDVELLDSLHKGTPKPPTTRKKKKKTTFRAHKKSPTTSSPMTSYSERAADTSLIRLVRQDIEATRAAVQESRAKNKPSTTTATRRVPPTATTTTRPVPTKRPPLVRERGIPRNMTMGNDIQQQGDAPTRPVSPTPAAAITTRPPAPATRPPLERRISELMTMGDDIQQQGDTPTRPVSPTQAAATATRPPAPATRPSLERRISELLTIGDDIQQGDAILFPRARPRRSHSGRRETLITSTKKQPASNAVVSTKTSSSRWLLPFQLLRRQTPPPTAALSQPSWRPSSMRLRKKPSLPQQATPTRSQSLRNTPKKPSWDDVPDASEFPPSFFGNPVVVAKASNPL